MVKANDGGFCDAPDFEPIMLDTIKDNTGISEPIPNGYSSARRNYHHLCIVTSDQKRPKELPHALHCCPVVGHGLLPDPFVNF